MERGTIWWKEKWNDTFTAIVRSGHQTKVRTSGGTVMDLKIGARTIKAQVLGRGRMVYRVQIAIPPFNEEQLLEIIDVLRRSPAIRATLARTQLPVQLFEELQRRGVFLFPSSWADLERIDCSCGDRSLPCRHIAAVLGQVGAAIGRDPFLVFRLHGCDLPAIVRDILEEDGVSDDQKIPLLEELFRQKNAMPSPSEPDRSVGDEPLEQIPFGPLPDLANSIQSLLTPNPPFCEQNFQPILMEALALWKRRIQTSPLRRATDTKRKFLTLFGEVSGPNSEWLDDSDDENEELDFDSEFRRRWKYLLQVRSLSILINSRKEIIGLADGKEPLVTCDDVEELVSFLDEVPEEASCELCEELQFLSSLLRFTNDLVGRTALVPQLLKNSRNELFVRWIPAFFNWQVRNDFSRFVSLCPKRLFLFQGKPLPATEQVLSAIDMFFQQLRSSYRLNVLHLLRNGRDEELGEIFFQGRPLDPVRRLREGELQDWLAPLHALNGNRRAHLTVRERDDGNFALSIALSSCENSQPVPLEEIFAGEEDRTAILSALNPIFGQIPEMESLRDRPEEVREIIVSLERFTEIFVQTFPRLRQMGIEIVLPKSLTALRSPKLRLAIEMRDTGDGRKPFCRLASALRFDWLIAVDGHRLSVEEFRKLTDNGGEIVPFAGKYLDGDEVQLLRRQLEKLPQKLGQGILFQAALAGDIGDAPV
ncbi:MAG: SWIM zinc finger family protein, partial [Puniceicoccales bacterium]|nr:SWIM zinc finger family protein [Puniceicoccales bacterium]